MEKTIDLECYFNTEAAFQVKELGLDDSIDNYKLSIVRVIKNKVSFYYEDDLCGVDCLMINFGGNSDLCANISLGEFEYLLNK